MKLLMLFICVTFIFSAEFSQSRMSAFTESKISFEKENDGEENGGHQNGKVPKSPYNFDQIFSHLHNKVVHFPVALSLLALIFSLIKIKRPEYFKPLLITIIISVICAGIAYLSGETAEEAYKGPVSEGIIENHQLLGTLTGISYLVWLIFLIIKPLRRIDFVIGIITTGLALFTGFLGGYIAHTL